MQRGGRTRAGQAHAFGADVVIPRELGADVAQSLVGVAAQVLVHLAVAHLPDDDGVGVGGRDDQRRAREPGRGHAELDGRAIGAGGVEADHDGLGHLRSSRSRRPERIFAARSSPAITCLG
jgi:hypothetical protein